MGSKSYKCVRVWAWQEQMEALGMQMRGQEAKKRYAFWETQPVAQFDDEEAAAQVTASCTALEGPEVVLLTGREGSLPLSAGGTHR